MCSISHRTNDIFGALQLLVPVLVLDLDSFEERRTYKDDLVGDQPMDRN